ncbi:MULTISPECIES: aldehyde reductase [unclassified Spirosoma]|uniref:SDR family oxidoreductase n=1 Tax=unclassified Spirosoma TaxID=2621999 RepID=UPI00095D61F4|nr:MULTISPECIES: aldehyde reductase [unclassified Spirosoma]MBN8826950.1 aldehyde reductase [Spirosoma sp.]OJW70678.1 MAG: aldehyde reductase [Spirosoma sp. 48-14]
MTNQTVLVTGGTGFVGIHTILSLLQKGYTVKTTVRSLAKKEAIVQALNEAGIVDLEKLSYVEADLTSDGGWEEAAQGCTYVLHVASPFPLVQPEDENELIIPAREGSLRVLKAARKAGVKRVVMTSSFAAIGYSINSKEHIFTENDWTDENAPVQPYIKSKTIAEKAAWDFIKHQGEGLELTVINPVGIFGPIIGGIFPASYEGVIKALVDGTVTESPQFTFGVVDVRDVADIHIKAMVLPEAKGQRFLATSDGVVSFYDVAQLIKQERPQKAGRMAELKPIDPSYYITMSNQKARDLLNWHPRSKEEAILASLDSEITK